MIIMMDAGRFKSVGIHYFKLHHRIQISRSRYFAAFQIKCDFFNAICLHSISRVLKLLLNSGLVNLLH